MPDSPATPRPPLPALLAVLTTVASREQALALARSLLAQRLVACAQLQPIDSLYHWQGSLQCEPEVRLLLKTTAAHWPALQSAIRAAHPYELPAIVALPLTESSADFAAWVAGEVGAGAPGPLA